MNILLTGGRAPVCLELARNFGRHGHTVYVAESLVPTMTAASRYVTQAYTVPSPRFHTRAYIHELIAVIQTTQAEVLIPTCEEVFYIARYRAEIVRRCPWVRVETPSFRTIAMLHDKDRFITFARRRGVAVPRTQRVHGKDALSARRHCGEKVVYKPVYSRFGAQVRVVGPHDATPVLDKAYGAWLCQEFIEGTTYCSYSYARHGHVLYTVIYWNPLASTGVATFFVPVSHDGITHAVTEMVANLTYDGHISFDFIVTPDGTAVVIECNPRVTSGIHMIGHHDIMALLGATPTVEAPLTPRRTQLALMNLNWHLLCPKVAKLFLQCTDRLFAIDDMRPVVAGLLSLRALSVRARQGHMSLAEASTHDIQWDGGPL